MTHTRPTTRPPGSAPAPGSAGTPGSARALSPGFTLMEVLVALGIFVLGFAAVAAIFPAAAVLQRNTASDVRTEHLQRSAKAVIQATRVTYDPDPDGNPSTVATGGDLAFYHSATSSTEQRLLPFENSGGDLTPEEVWPLDTRSFPGTTVVPAQRDFFWLPLIRDRNGDPTNPDWQMVVFVLQRRNNVDYAASGRTYAELDAITIPGLSAVSATASGSTFTVSSTTTGLRENDILVDNIGGIYKVDSVAIGATTTDITVTGVIVQQGSLPDAVWYAPRPAGVTSSPITAVFTLTPTVTP